MSASNDNGAFPADARSAAELYLNRGLAPVPLPTRSKKPGYPGWQNLRLTRDDLAGRFPAGQARNLGVLNGTPSGNALDVDLDCPEARQAASLLLPPTGWVFGRNTAPASHRIYRADRSPDAAQEKFTDLDGSVLVELRGTGGMTVYPPSIHAGTGETISWERFTEPAGVSLDALQRAVHELAAAALLARHWPAEGARQDAFLALAGGLLRGGWRQERVETFIRALALATGDEESRKRIQTVAQTAAKIERDRKTNGWPRLTEMIGTNGEEVTGRVRRWLGLMSARGTPTGAKKVRGVAPYREFPVDSLPCVLRDFVGQCALAFGCDPAYVALPALAALASAVGNTRTIQLRPGWEEPCVLWPVVIGDSGTLKSPAFRKAVAHLHRVQKRIQREFLPVRARYLEEVREWRAAKRRGEEASAGPPPVEPRMRRVICSDITIEKLADILEDNPRGTLMARDELASWVGSFTRYKGAKGGTDLPNWLEMSSAGNLIVDRKTGDRQTLMIERAAVSVTGTIQPRVLARVLTPEYLESGFAARLLLAQPPRRVKRWTEAEVTPEAERAYTDTLDRLWNLGFANRGGEEVPHAIPLSPDGKAAWIDFYNLLAGEQAAAEGELAAALSKLEGYAARLALVHHVVGRVSRGENDLEPVGPESVRAGITLARWFENEARRIYATLSESPDERDFHDLVEFIRRRGGSITVRDLMRSNCRRFPNAEAAEAALAALVEAGVARWIAAPTAMKGGKPVKAVELCVTHDTDDTDDTDSDDDPGAPDTPHDGPDGQPGGGPGTAPVRPVDADCDRDRADGPGGVIGVIRHTRSGGVEVNGDKGGPPGVLGEAAFGVMPHASSSPTAVVTRLVDDGEGLEAVSLAIGETAVVGVSLVTTGDDPVVDRVRQLSVACDTIDGGTVVYGVDCLAVDPSPLWGTLAGSHLVAHDAARVLRFLRRLGFTPAGRVSDTMLLAKLIVAGTTEAVTLAACLRRWLGRELDEQGQKPWEPGADSPSSAVRAAAALVPLLGVLMPAIENAGLGDAAEIEQRALPALAWMGERGVALDRAAGEAPARAADEEAAAARRDLDAAAPANPDAPSGVWNWDSSHQALTALRLAGCGVSDTADETLAAADRPLARLLRRYRAAGRRGGAFAAGLLAHVRDDGRVYPNWNQLGAASGRISCSAPNMQQLPRGDHRRAVAAPSGRALVVADYSQIELRIAAKVSGDAAMLEAFERGHDLHAITARNVLRVADVTDEQRRLAKALNFGLIFGMGASRFRAYAMTRYGLTLTEREVRGYRDAFFSAYPGLAAWHRRVRSGKATETRTLTGRRRRLPNGTPDTVRLNTPVQGAGADGLKIALALLWERRALQPTAFPVLAVHDEIVVEVDADRADDAAAWLKDAMLDAMSPLLDPVPVRVEVAVGPSWADTGK